MNPPGKRTKDRSARSSRAPRWIARPALVALFGITLVLYSAPSELHGSSPPPIGPFLNPATGHWYFRIGVASYDEACDFAESVDGYLVSILDVAEQQWLISQFPDQGTSIGLTDEGSPGVYHWLSGEPVGFTDWASGPPAPQSTPRHARGFDDWVPAPYSSSFHALVEVETPVLAIVPGFVCDGQVGGAALTWDTPGFDTVRIWREGQLIATLPASLGNYFDATPPGSTGYILSAMSAAGTSLPSVCRAQVIDPDYTVRIPDVVVPHPGPARVPILLDHLVGQVQGFSLGVCHDTSAVELISVDEGADILAVMPWGAGFFSAGPYPGGFAMGCVVDLFATVSLPPGLDQEIAAANLEPLGSPPFSTPLDICDTLGIPAVSVVVVVGQISLFPVDVDGSVTFTIERFRRGDGNVDGAIDLADVLFLGTNLFSPAADDFPCHEACEVNGDARIDIADMVYTLSYLFVAGPPPGAPFPNCDADPDLATGFGCGAGSNCP